LKLCPAEDVERVRAWFAAGKLPTSIGDLPELGATVDDLIEIMRQDKKAAQGKLVLVLARGVGQAFVARDVETTAIRAVLAQALQRNKIPSAKRP
jgi:3-dehydroquinate synthetase